MITEQDITRLEKTENKPSVKTERLMLESVLVKQLNGVIKKQNDEIDALLKQKEYLQSKLREKNGEEKKEEEKK